MMEPARKATKEASLLSSKIQSSISNIQQPPPHLATRRKYFSAGFPVTFTIAR